MFNPILNTAEVRDFVSETFSSAVNLSACIRLPFSHIKVDHFYVAMQLLHGVSAHFQLHAFNCSQYDRGPHVHPINPVRVVEITVHRDRYQRGQRRTEPERE